MTSLRNRLDTLERSRGGRLGILWVDPFDYQTGDPVLRAAHIAGRQIKRGDGETPGDFLRRAIPQGLRTATLEADAEDL